MGSSAIDKCRKNPSVLLPIYVLIYTSVFASDVINVSYTSMMNECEDKGENRNMQAYLIEVNSELIFNRSRSRQK